MSTYIIYSLHGRRQDFFRGTLFRKFSKNFLRKLPTAFSYFSKSLTNHALTFPAFGQKTQFVGNF